MEEVGPQVTTFTPGDRVVCLFNFSCGACEHCRAGHHNVCPRVGSSGFMYSGGYGRLAHVPLADMNLVPLPESIPFVDEASLGCRFMTAFHGIVDQAQVQPGEWVAVHGCGGIGLAAIQIALGQKTHTRLLPSVDGPAITRSTACIPPGDTPYSLAKHATRAEVAKTHGLEALAGVYHRVGRSGTAAAP